MNAAAQPYTIMIVDDQKFIRMAVVKMLSDIPGFPVAFVEAAHGREALERLAERPVDLIMTDLEMPEMDGFELIRALKASDLYSGEPIIFLTAHSDDGSKIMAFELGATDYVVKPFLEQELRARVTGYLERRRSLQQVREFQGKVRAELAQARELQKILLPDTPPAVGGLKVAQRYVPFDEVGGDIFDAVRTADGSLGLFVADVSGHGVPAALITFMISTIFKGLDFQSLAPHEVVGRINDGVLDVMPDERFTTAFCGRYRPADRTFSCTLAGSPPALIRRADGSIEQFGEMGRLVGMFPSAACAWRTVTTRLRPGDVVLVFTDAIYETRSAEGRILGIAGLAEWLGARPATDLEALLDDLRAHGAAWSASGKFDDDMTLFGIEVLS